MSENQAPSEGVMIPSSPKMREEDTQKYRSGNPGDGKIVRYLGVQLQTPPWQDRSLNHIYCEWIDKYAADFRKYWEGKKQDNQQIAVDPPCEVVECAPACV